LLVMGHIIWLLSDPGPEPLSYLSIVLHDITCNDGFRRLKMIKVKWNMDLPVLKLLAFWPGIHANTP
jgi:hypothetical protein